jgi:hypothetical protein
MRDIIQLCSHRVKTRCTADLDILSNPFDGFLANETLRVCLQTPAPILDYKSIGLVLNGGDQLVQIRNVKPSIGRRGRR